MMKIDRYPENPLVSPADVRPSREGWEVICAFNAGIIEHNGETMMLMRVAERPINPDPSSKVLVPVMNLQSVPLDVHVLSFSVDTEGISLHDPRVVCFPDRVYLTSISHLRLAKSTDGRKFEIEDTPALKPDQKYEEFGLEDPRITKIGDTYYIVYKGVASTGITQCLASTKDFVNYEKHGIIFCPENMDAMIFPEKVGGRYVAFHRPQPRMMGAPNMWVAYSEDLINWGDHKFLLGTTGGTWEGGRIGGGSVPFLTEKGWLEIYHAATPDDRYCLGAIICDKDCPEKVIAKTVDPIMEPEAPYETHGFKDNVVFTCGGIVDGDTYHMYYGAADMVMAGADISISEVLDACEPV